MRRCIINQDLLISITAIYSWMFPEHYEQYFEVAVENHPQKEFLHDKIEERRESWILIQEENINKKRNLEK